MVSLIHIHCANYVCITTVFGRLLAISVDLEQIWQTHRLNMHTWSPFVDSLSMGYSSLWLLHFHRKYSFVWFRHLWHAGCWHRWIQFQHYHRLQRFYSKFSESEFFPTLPGDSTARTYLAMCHFHQYTVKCHACQCKYQRSSFVDRYIVLNAKSNAIKLMFGVLKLNSKLL